MTKKKKYSLGGEVLKSTIPTALSLIPGVGPILGAASSAIIANEEQQNAMGKQIKRNMENLTSVSNPYQFENGGMLQGSEDAAMYKGNNHSAGGIGINNNGIPDLNTELEVEGEEFKIDLPNKKTYIFSKKLKV